jgi:hypothetical protein
MQAIKDGKEEDEQEEDTPHPSVSAHPSMLTPQARVCTYVRVHVRVCACGCGWVG